MNRTEIITIDNYEIFVVDYFDGALTSEETIALFSFLSDHPELKSDFFMLSECQDISQKPDYSVVFPNPETLKKNDIIAVQTINETNYVNFFIAYHEHDFDENAKKTIERFLEKNPRLRSDFSLFEKTKLIPDKTITFDKKSTLKRSSFPLRQIYYGITAAAAVLLIFFLISRNIKPATDVPIEIIAQPAKPVQPTIVPIHPLLDPVELPATSKPAKRFVETKQPATAQPTELRKEIALIDLLPMRNAEYIPTQETSAVFLSKVLEVDIVSIKKWSEADLQLIEQGEHPEYNPKKQRFWNLLSWSVKQYNQLSGDHIVVIRMENIQTSEVTYFFSDPTPHF